MGFDQFQRNKNVNRFGDFSSLDDSSILGAAASFADTRPSSINSNNPLIGASNNTKGLQWSFPQPLKGGGFVDQSSPCLQLSETEKKTRAGEQCILEQIKPQVGFAPKSSDAYDDLRTPMIKGEQERNIFDDDMGGFDACLFCSCIDSNHIYKLINVFKGWKKG